MVYHHMSLLNHQYLLIWLYFSHFANSFVIIVFNKFRFTSVIEIIEFVSIVILSFTYIMCKFQPENFKPKIQLFSKTRWSVTHNTSIISFKPCFAHIIYILHTGFLEMVYHNLFIFIFFPYSQLLSQPFSKSQASIF